MSCSRIAAYGVESSFIKTSGFHAFAIKNGGSHASTLRKRTSSARAAGLCHVAERTLLSSRAALRRPPGCNQALETDDPLLPSGGYLAS
jgi:hypothetical protein